MKWLNMSLTNTGVAIVGVLLAFFFFHSLPPLPYNIRDWQRAGNMLDYKGHSVFYLDVGGRGKGTLICLHGFPTFSWDWSKILPGLQKQFSRIILLDFLGYGLSDKPTSHQYSIFEQADIVTHVTWSLRVKEAHLLSHDYGDTVAQELVFRHNQETRGKMMMTTKVVPSLTVQSLVMLNGGVFPETNFPRPVQKLMLVPVIGPVLGCFNFFHLFKRGFGEVFGDNQPSEEEFRDFYSALLHKNGHHVTASLLQYIPERHANRQRWVGALKETDIPVLMVYGPADPVNPPAFADLFRKEFPQHKLVVLNKGIGHYPQWEDSQSVMQNIAEFQQTHFTADTASDK